MIRHVVACAALVAGLCGCAPATAPMPPVDHLRQTVTLGPPLDVTLSYLSAGDPDGVRVILVHGTPGNARIWTDYVINAPVGVEVVAVDRPGFGRSGPHGAVVSLADQAAALLPLLRPDGRNVLLGHSLGGPIVAWAAAAYPDRVAAVILLAASMDPELEKIHPLQWVGTWWPIRHFLPRPLRNANTELIGLKPELEKLAALLPGIAAPVLIIHGTDDGLVPFANVAFMERTLSGSCRRETLALRGYNHFLPETAGDVIRDAMVKAGGLGC